MLEPLRTGENVRIGLSVWKTVALQFITLLGRHLWRHDKVIEVERSKHANQVRDPVGLAGTLLQDDDWPPDLGWSAADLPDLFAVQQLRGIGVSHNQAPQAELSRLAGRLCSLVWRTTPMRVWRKRAP